MENTVMSTFSVEITTVKKNASQIIDQTEQIKEAIKTAFSECDDIHVRHIKTKNFII